MKICTVVGARPQFIKAWSVSRAVRAAGHRETLIHTGQHYDDMMSRVFFDEMGLPAPDRNLGIGSGAHGVQTARMLEALESVLLEDRPDVVLCYGDTNTTLATALAACKLGMPLAHVEAGLRSFNRSMPEEHNRVITDHCSTLLFCPTATSAAQLAREGISDGVHVVGDVMLDAVRHFSRLAESRSSILSRLRVETQGYFLATIHRAYNTDTPGVLDGILRALAALDTPVILPLHPRTRVHLNGTGLAADGSLGAVRLIEPVGFLDMLVLEAHARLILTDSGGVQKEAFFCGVPCVTLRPETEWTETVDAGWNVVAGADPAKIPEVVANVRRPSEPPPPLFGDGNAGSRIAEILRGTG